MKNNAKETFKSIVKDIKKAFPNKKVSVYCIVNKKAWKHHNGCPKRWTCKKINSEQCNDTYSEMKNRNY